MSETYITPITHYLDADGQISEDLSESRRKLVSSLVLIVDAVTRGVPVIPVRGFDTRIRCRKAHCFGSISALLMSVDDEIFWVWPVCGQNGVICRWQNTKWDVLAEEKL